VSVILVVFFIYIVYIESRAWTYFISLALYLSLCFGQVVVAQLVGVGSFLLPTQVRVSFMRHVAPCEPIILEILDPPMFSRFQGDYRGCSKLRVVNHNNIIKEKRY
jgi:hypothetical protein